MNKKFSTLMAACLAAGALVLPADMFAQLQYANEKTYESVATYTALPSKTSSNPEYYWVVNRGGVDYVITVDGNKLILKPFLAATEADAIKIKYLGKDQYTIASENGTLGNVGDNPWTDFGTASTMSHITFANGTIAVEYGSGAFVYFDEETQQFAFSYGTIETDKKSFSGKSISTSSLEEIPDVRPVVTGDINFGGTSYVIMAAGQVLDGTNDGEVKFVSDAGKQSTYWTLEKHETTATAGYALLKNKENGEYMTIGGDQVAVKISKTGNEWGLDLNADNEFQLFVITDWNTPKTVEMNGVAMSEFKLGQVKATTISAAQLRTIFGDSFGVEMKKGNDALQNNPFTGSLKLVTLSKNRNGLYTETVLPVTSDSHSFMLQKENGKLIVVQLNKKYADAQATYGYSVVEVSAHDLALALNDDMRAENKVADSYAPFFIFHATEDFFTGVDKEINWITAYDYINGKEYTLGSLNYGANEGKPTLSAEDGSGLTYLDKISIKLGTFNTVDVKKLLASPAFFTLTNKNTKAKYSPSNYGKVLGLDQNGYIAWVNADEALVGYPETEWAITYDPSTKVLTFKNRENPTAIWGYDVNNNPVEFTYHESQIYNIAGKTNVFAINGDTIEFKANTQYKESDGYLRLDAQKLKDQLYYVGVSSSVWDGIAYVSENHKDNHQVGLDVNQKNATEWNLAAAWYTEKNSLGETTVSRPDTIQIGSTMSYWSAADNAFKTTDKDGKQTVFLKLLAYSMQNEENAEFMAYRWSDTRYATGSGSIGYTSGDYFALKMTGDDKYNLVEVVGNQGYRSLNNVKVYGGSSATKGILNQTGMYKQVENDLFVIEETDAPEYLKLNQGDVIKIFRNEYESNVLYEKGEFAGINNAVEFDKINPALYVDTAYYNRPGNNRWEYLLAVDVNRIDTTYQCNVPAHGVHRMDTTYGRFLVNLADSAIVEDTRDVHVNKFVYEDGMNRYAKLGFVPGYHTNDTLFVDCTEHGSDIIEVGTSAPQLVKFAFRVVDHETESFVIETGYKYPQAFDGNKVQDYKGYLTYINGNLVVTNDEEAAEVFSLKSDDRTPTANETITAGNVVVAGTNGAVVVKGAEGKNVIVSTILGKVVANEVVSSDDAQIATPAGIVVVSVDGESFKVVVK